MRVLLVKTSSMGDVIHTLPALTDAGRAISGIRFDWIVEENFAEIPAWHPLVDRVIKVAVRRWRKKIFSKETYQGWKELRDALKNTHYDLIIDAQGLMKSAWITLLAKGVRGGLDYHSARESLAALFYQKKYSVEFKQHAVIRMRSLLSQALGYPLPIDIADYGVDRKHFFANETSEDYLVFLHGTTWATKHWPEEYWVKLTEIAHKKGFKIKLPWGSDAERARAERIAKNCSSAEVLPRLNLIAAAKIIAGAKAIVAVDTGLGHLAAALDVPTVSLYGPTNPILTGTLGKSQAHLRANFSCAPCLSRECAYQDQPSPLYSVKPPCFTTLPPDEVWRMLERLF
ncbi:MAG: hypothetical protein ACD_60C00030G0020 [uncultured bacterium]|nr:MAG: hypothetical protein ACD_60C00030G0020 [uncultured bacterium]